MGQHAAEMARGIDRSQGARPAKFVPPHRHRAGLDAAMREEQPRRDNDAQPQRAHRGAHRIIVRELVGERCEAADALQRLASQRDRRAHARMLDPEREAHQHRRRELPPDRGGGETRPSPRIAPPVVNARHRPDAGLRQRGGDAGEVVARHRHVAVAQHQQVMPRGGDHVREVGDLGIAAERGSPRRHRHLACQRARHVDCGVVGAVAARNHLHRRGPVLIEKGAEVLRQARLRPMERLEHRHRLRLRGRGARGAGKAAHGEGGVERVADPRDGENEGKPADDRCQCHVATVGTKRAKQNRSS